MSLRLSVWLPFQPVSPENIETGGLSGCDSYQANQDTLNWSFPHSWDHTDLPSLGGTGYTSWLGYWPAVLVLLISRLVSLPVSLVLPGSRKPTGCSLTVQPASQPVRCTVNTACTALLPPELQLKDQNDLSATQTGKIFQLGRAEKFSLFSSALTQTSQQIFGRNKNALRALYPCKVISWIDSLYSGHQNAIKPTGKK